MITSSAPEPSRVAVLTRVVAGALVADVGELPALVDVGELAGDVGELPALVDVGELAAGLRLRGLGLADDVGDVVGAGGIGAGDDVGAGPVGGEPIGGRNWPGACGDGAGVFPCWVRPPFAAARAGAATSSAG